MAELAVVVPTRSRPHNVQRVVQAWHETGGFDAADLHFAYDADDMQAPQYGRLFRSMAEVRNVVLPTWKPLVPKLNQVALNLTMHYPLVAFMGDDHVPRTQRWAHMLVERHLTGRGPRIVYGQDGFMDSRLPTWWSMDSRIIRTLQGMVPAPVQHMYCDNAVLELGKAAMCLDYDERILIEHMHPVAGKAPTDAQYARVNRPQQYERDRVAFIKWLRHGLATDATLVRSI